MDTCARSAWIRRQSNTSSSASAQHQEKHLADLQKALITQSALPQKHGPSGPWQRWFIFIASSCKCLIDLTFSRRDPSQKWVMTTVFLPMCRHERATGPQS
ncbi:Lipoprotein signal peptidase [Clarias magur]|uniref:Lipoprotein signal peptidase n=1 Tax=Clarias magur TaxID=1594786 RepID=A0A8J4XAA5_CLAMG|nr:Lipoprotein signal peptidase [Clarias magur]